MNRFIGRRLSLFGPLVFVAFGILASCSSGEILRPDVIVASWQNPDTPVIAYKKLLVIFYDNDEKVRAETERGAVDKMRTLGADAAASVDMEPNIDNLEDSARVISMLDEVGADALMSVEFVEFKEGYRTRSDGMVAAWLIATAIDDDLRTIANVASVADRAASDLASLEVSLWDAESNQKVWSATADIQTYSDNQGDSQKFAEVVIQEMKKQGYL